jgi:hypothetical protein
MREKLRSQGVFDSWGGDALVLGDQDACLLLLLLLLPCTAVTCT